MTDLILSFLQLLEAFGTWIIREPSAPWIFAGSLGGIILLIGWIKSRRF